MKKLLLLATFVVAAVSADAQVHKMYCSLVGTAKPFSTKVTVQVDFGEDMGRGFLKDNRLKGEDGKPIVFNSMIDALNYMGQMGWVFEQAYVVSNAQQQVYTYIMSKDAEDETAEASAAEE